MEAALNLDESPLAEMAGLHAPASLCRDTLPSAL